MPSLSRGGTGYWRVVLCVALAWEAAFPVGAASPEVERLNQRAVALNGRGQYEEAAELFMQALRLGPNDEVIRRNLSGLRTRWGHQPLRASALEQAQEQYQAALELNPNESAASTGLGDIQLRRREPRLAAESYRQAMRVDPRNPDAHIRFGEAYFHQSDLTAALSEWERALALRPGDVRLRNRIQEVQNEARVQGGYLARVSQHFTVAHERDSGATISGRSTYGPLSGRPLMLGTRGEPNRRTKSK